MYGMTYYSLMVATRVKTEWSNFSLMCLLNFFCFLKIHKWDIYLYIWCLLYLVEELLAD